MSKRFFIASSGTDIGKTFITAALTYQLKQQGKGVLALKPLISGWEEQGTDTHILLEAMGKNASDKSIDAISPWRFKAALAPNMAAHKESREIDVEALRAFCAKQNDADITLIETAGGVMAPVTDHYHTLHWMRDQGYPAILVVGSYLGTISHTLTAIAAMNAFKVPLHTVIISESQNNTVDLDETAKSIQGFLPKNIPIITIARQSSSDGWKQLIGIDLAF